MKWTIDRRKNMDQLEKKQNQIKEKKKERKSQTDPIQ